MILLNLIISYFKSYKKHVIIYILASLVVWAIAIILPYITGFYIDTLLNNIILIDIMKFSVMVIFLNIINQAFRYLNNLMATKLGNNVSFSLSYDIYERLKRAPLEFHKQVDAVYLSQRVSNDSTTIVNFFLSNSISIITSLFTLIFGIIILCDIDYWFVSFIVILVPLYIIMYKFFRESLFKANYTYIEKQSEYYSQSAQQFKNIRFIKINSLYEEVAKKLRAYFEVYLLSIIKNYNINFAFSNLSTILLIVSNGFIVFYGGIQVSKGNISIGQFTIINTYFNLIINSISFFMNLGSSYQQAQASYIRLLQYLEIDLEYDSEKEIKKVNSIIIDNFSFRYETSKHIFKLFNYSFEHNNIYVINGKNGSGKTTLVNILCGLYTDKYNGEIMFDEFNMKELNLEKIRYNLLSVTLQEPILLKDTILDNLTLGLAKKDVNLSEVEYYCEKLDILNKIRSLPNKFDTIISESNQEFSGGEKQKIALIRSFLKKANVLILDEPTSALDKNSINSLKQVLLEIKNNRIIIVITHDNQLMNVTTNILNIERLIDI